MAGTGGCKVASPRENGSHPLQAWETQGGAGVSSKPDATTSTSTNGSHPCPSSARRTNIANGTSDTAPAPRSNSTPTVLDAAVPEVDRADVTKSTASPTPKAEAPAGPSTTTSSSSTSPSANAATSPTTAASSSSTSTTTITTSSPSPSPSLPHETSMPTGDSEGFENQDQRSPATGNSSLSRRGGGWRAFGWDSKGSPPTGARNPPPQYRLPPRRPPWPMYHPAHRMPPPMEQRVMDDWQCPPMMPYRGPGGYQPSGFYEQDCGVPTCMECAVYPKGPMRPMQMGMRHGYGPMMPPYGPEEVTRMAAVMNEHLFEMDPDEAPPRSAGEACNIVLRLYKTKLCRNWQIHGSCSYMDKCMFAHGEQELRKRQKSSNMLQNYPLAGERVFVSVNYSNGNKDDMQPADVGGIMDPSAMAGGEQWMGGSWYQHADDYGRWCDAPSPPWYPSGRGMR
eukprot:Sspe_Gene.39846::Locus_19209_Transcript_1_1_Confidence_1.000_Length_1608::g.39846::m.39846